MLRPGDISAREPLYAGGVVYKHPSQWCINTPASGVFLLEPVLDRQHSALEIGSTSMKPA